MTPRYNCIICLQTDSSFKERKVTSHQKTEPVTGKDD